MGSLCDHRYEMNVHCCVKGRFVNSDKGINASVDWVQVSGGAYDGLWIPLAAISMDNPGVARSLHNLQYVVGQVLAGAIRSWPQIYIHLPRRQG